MGVWRFGKGARDALLQAQAPAWGATTGSRVPSTLAHEHATQKDPPGNSVQHVWQPDAVDGRLELRTPDRAAGSGACAAPPPTLLGARRALPARPSSTILRVTSARTLVVRTSSATPCCTCRHVQPHFDFKHHTSERTQELRGCSFRRERAQPRLQDQPEQARKERWRHHASSRQDRQGTGQTLFKSTALRVCERQYPRHSYAAKAQCRAMRRFFSHLSPAEHRSPSWQRPPRLRAAPPPMLCMLRGPQRTDMRAAALRSGAGRGAQRQANGNHGCTASETYQAYYKPQLESWLVAPGLPI